MFKKSIIAALFAISLAYIAVPSSFFLKPQSYSYDRADGMITFQRIVPYFGVNGISTTEVRVIETNQECYSRATENGNYYQNTTTTVQYGANDQIRTCLDAVGAREVNTRHWVYFDLGLFRIYLRPVVTASLLEDSVPISRLQTMFDR